MNPYSPDLTVDQVIGSAYQVVKYVASNMEMLIDLSAKIPVLESYMDEINSVLANIAAITTVANDIDSVNVVATNMNAVNIINTNITALLVIYTNLTEILAVPAAIAAQDWKNSVVVATTGNITLSGVQSIDGVATTAGQRVLVKNQTTPSQNGIYVVAAGAWSRAADAQSPNVSTNNVVMVESGTVGAGKLFRLSTAGSITVGITPQSWTEFTSAPTIEGENLAGDPVTVTAASKVTYNGEHFTLTVTGSQVAVALSQAVQDAIEAGGSEVSAGQVINAILTDGTNILMDSDGNVLFEETV